jgi:hypothetical protein
MTWVMLFTLVMVSLVPSLSRAAAFVQGDTAPWSVVCVAPDTAADAGAAPADARHLLEHCPLCMLQVDGLGLPPDGPQRIAALALGHALPMLFLRAPRPLPAWLSAQPRAPPRAA